MDNNLHKQATELLAHGINTLPVRADHTKAPALKGWQKLAVTQQDLDSWFGGDQPQYTAMGIVTGDISGHLEMAEIEGKVQHRLGELAALAKDSGLGDTWATLAQGWMEQSPSGGIHWFYRVSNLDIPGNTKLATRASTPEELAENPDQKWQTLAETRGTGGQAVGAPTGGHAHETGNPWTRLTGGPATVPTISTEQRDAFLSVLASLDEPRSNGTPVNTGNHTRTTPSTFTGSTPGDDYEAKTTWAEILEPSGWTVVRVQGSTTYWCRPGKTMGISATTGHADDRDRLYVFSSSTDFPEQESITKLHAYTILQHDGDHSAAAGALRKQGYGEAQHISTELPAQAETHTQHFTDPDTWDTTFIPNYWGTNETEGTDTDSTEEVSRTVETDTATITVTGPADQVNTMFGPTEQPTKRDGTLPLTDDGNAILFLREHGHEVRYNTDSGKWLVWNGHVWQRQPSGGGAARELAKHTGRGLPEDGIDGAKKTLAHKTYSLGYRGIVNLLASAQTHPSITVVEADLDSHPWELNTPNGTIDLQTGELHPSNPAHLHTRSTICALDPTVTPAVFEAFLTTTFPDIETRLYVQRLMGYSSIGEVREHLLPFCFGSGGNGKSVLLETVRAVLGGYAGTAPSGFLMNSSYQKHETELADLSGRRFVICSEVNEDDKFDEAKVKRLAGGDTVKARFMRQDFFEFPPTHHLWLMGNHQPAVDSGGPSFWRRLRLIPFTTQVEEADQVEDLQGQLSESYGPAVLAWIVEGAKQYSEHKLLEPTSVRAATAQYEQDADTVGRFLEDACYTGPSYLNETTPVTDLRAAYETWCRKNGETETKGRAFTSKIARHGILTGRNVTIKGTGGSRLYQGVLLKETEESRLDFHEPREREE